MTHDLMERLSALSKAHELIRPRSEAQSRAVELEAILAVLLNLYINRASNHLTIVVPKILVGEHSATAIAMIVHELATNSMKYGALSTAFGKRYISGHHQAADVEIIWKEMGGPPILSTPQVPGFGSRLVMRSVKDQLGGTMKVDWPVEGIVVALKLSKARLGA